MRTPEQSLKTALCASAILLVGALLVRTAFAEEASSGAHGDERKDQPRLPRRVAISRPRKERPERELKASLILRKATAAKITKAVRPTTANRRRNAAPSVQTGKDSSNADVHVEPMRRLDKKKNKPGENNATLQSKLGLSRRLSPVPQAPNPVRNSIGVVVPAP